VATLQPEYLTVGQVVGSFGIRGELKVRVLTEFPQRFSELHTVHLGRERQSFRVDAVRLHKSQALMKLRGIDSREQSDQLIGDEVAIPLGEAWPLDQDQYYIYQMIGLMVITADGEAVGEVADVLPIGQTGANDVLVVGRTGKDVLIPLVKAFVRKIDVQAGVVVVDNIEGLL
jgi:16S rRNA processing protein RimM